MSEVAPGTIWYITPTHHGHTKAISWPWMDNSHPFSSMSIGHPIPQIRVFQTVTLKFQECGQKARSYSWPSRLLIRFLFISHQSDQQFLIFKYFEIWPCKNQGQGHEWGQRSRSHSIPSIEPKHFPFASHQSGQPFLRYGQKSVWPWKTHLRNFKRKFAKKKEFRTEFLQNLTRQ